MRMWKVNPQRMCRQHLLGEHLEMHMFASSIDQGKSITGFIENNLVEVHNIKSRHDELVIELLRRGYSHKSPLNFQGDRLGHVDVQANIEELKRRCKECYKR